MRCLIVLCFAGNRNEIEELFAFLMYQRKLSKMDLEKMLRHVNNLNDYISVTQEVSKYAFKSSKVQFNMSTVLLLKKVKALEIEYFSKCESNGAALVLFERMVEQPASKTWGLLGKELVILLQYWLDAMRKHLIRHSHHWWTFLKLLLKFISGIRSKDRSLPDILVELTTESLLDLASSTQPDILQRYEILCCLNLVCAESSREIRFALRNKFETYFLKLATLLPSCGHLPAQYSILETLLRWLLPRQSSSVRQTAARDWFPEAVCGRRALELFLERPWQDFFQDARDFLNACNGVAELVTSVVCRKLTVGSVAVVLGTEKRETWLDVNSSHGSVSVVLDARLAGAGSWEALCVSPEETVSVQLCRESSEVTVLINTSSAVRLRPSGAVPGGEGLRAVLSTRADLRKLDTALREAFGDKYQVLLDLDLPLSLSPQENRETSNKIQNNLEEDTRFSHPVEVQRRKHSGFIVRPRNPVAWPSPSTASTTSLAQLHEKLESLPQYKFDKEAVHVCALPELSTVTEVSETDDRQSLLSTQTLKLNRPVGVCQKTIQTSERNSQSDGELQDKSKNRVLSPVDEDDQTNCLQVATIGSTDVSVINDTLERLTKNKDFRSDNIVNLLVQEALQKDFNEQEFLDSGINTGDVTKKTQNVNEICSEAIDNTPVESNKATTVAGNKDNENKCTVISNTTTDESNDVCETPKNFVTVRRRITKKSVLKEKENIVPEESGERQIFDVKAVEEFFSQHITENKRGEIVISPTLARKINETSSESEQFDDCLQIHEDIHTDVENVELQDFEIVECLNSMVDRVCSDFDKCAEFLKRDLDGMDAIEDTNNAVLENPPDVIPLTDVSNKQNTTMEKESKRTIKPSARKPIRLKYTAKKIVKSTKQSATKKNKGRFELKPPVAMSPIQEKNSDDAVHSEEKTPERNDNPVQSPKTDSSKSKSDDVNTPLTRRKRKLYSPKYEDINSEKMSHDDEDDELFKASKIQTPRYKGTCYKDIEITRKTQIRQPRSRKSTAKSDTSSPRTKKRNDMFDQLKEKVECPVTLVAVDKKTEKDMAMYNLTSDSEDEDFKKKKIEVQNRMSTTTVASCDSAMSTRKGRTVNRVNYSENKSSDETIKKSAAKQKKTIRRKRTPRTRLEKPVNEMIDEKMRKADQEKIDTSMIISKNIDRISNEPQLVLSLNPEMETIPDEVGIEECKPKFKKSNKRQKKAEVLSLKKDNNENNLRELDNDDRTISPLPGLVIETKPLVEDDPNDSVSTNMLQKLKKIHQYGAEEYINETNTTQNLLSDVERLNCSPLQINVTDEFDRIENKSKVEDEHTRSASKAKVKNRNEILRVKQEKEESKRISQSKDATITLSDTKSEKSIATVGKSPITAHGDSNEAPPQSDLLTENLKPRDLEIEYLDESMKDYFNKLRNEINDCSENRPGSNSSTISKIQARKENSTDRSPVVSIKRLSLDDISKWLPSPRHSDSESRSEDLSNDVNASIDLIANTSRRSNQQLKVTKLISKKTDQTVHNDDGDIRRSKRKKNKPEFLQYYSQNSSVKSAEDTSRRNATNSKWLRSHGDLDPENTSSENNVYEKSPDTKRTSDIDTGKKSKKNKELEINIGNRKSMISPIQFFDEIISNEKEISPILRPKSMSRDKSTIGRQESIIEKQQSDEEICVQTSVTSPFKKKQKKMEKTLRARRDSDESTDMVKNQDNVDFEVARRKRKSKNPETRYPKRMRTEEAATMSESGPSVSSVNEWFRRNATISRAESRDNLVDSLQSVMEKLDTTLAEIHQGTSKKFVHLFVDAQSRLADMRRERRAELQASAKDLAAQLVQAIGDKFADIDRRSAEMEAAFASQLKAQASQLIRADCARKHALVALLREDLAAACARQRDS